EKEKLEAERLGAVGQTVAGLAHSVKNILMGVEGGMYIIGSGIKKDSRETISNGWEMLKRNIDKVTILVKDFLSFAKGRRPNVRLMKPRSLIDEIIALYKDTAGKIKIQLIDTTEADIPEALLDPDAMHTCLTNLISNAIDACQMSSRTDCRVLIGVREENSVIIFEVSDNGCGVEYDIKQKVFTTFFTTKGGKGTGLGLLTTRKIIQEHGGKISLESTPGKGSKFKIEMPRNRLPRLEEEAA
ncbi:MAG: ATP-binding protein, partial [bacterium]